MTFKDGVININKPAGWTSQDVCAKLRNRLHIKKIGHTGTLDPMATGVLPVCIGKATRIIEYYDMDMKTYHAQMRLGIETDTLDIWGTVVSESSYEDVTEAAVRAAFAAYTGVVSQIPPKYSALKVNGKRAYDLAREGEDFRLKARVITILSNEISSLDLETGTIEFDVTCSKGTYIRTICDDIGRELGCGGTMTALVWCESGSFNIAEAVDIRELVEMTDEEIADHIIPMDETLINLGKAVLDDNRVMAFANGNPSGDRCFAILEATAFKPTGEQELNTGNYSDHDGFYRVYRLASDEPVFLGIGEVIGHELIPRKVITVNN